ncbi:MAG TPA: CBS domain-containing protein [Rhodanobacteraceae bacterium]|jgi:CBS domain-containing protein|nr:CBS domain-containing protein [Rhodanobacteraceae bacterium]
MNIKDVMTLNPICCPPGASLKEVAEIMRDEDIGEVPIVERDGGKKLLGVVTDRDIVVRTVAAGRNPASVTAGDCMTEPAITCKESDTLEDCAQAMAAHRIRRMPIVDGNGELCGIIAQADLQATDARSLKQQVADRVSTPH